MSLEARAMECGVIEKRKGIVSLSNLARKAPKFISCGEKIFAADRTSHSWYDQRHEAPV
jgi:hypothetical protein